MRALIWNGKEDIRCETVPDPAIQDGRDAIIKVSACAICGSDQFPQVTKLPQAQGLREELFEILNHTIKIDLVIIS